MNQRIIKLRGRKLQVSLTPAPEVSGIDVVRVKVIKDLGAAVVIVEDSADIKAFGTKVWDSPSLEGHASIHFVDGLTLHRIEDCEYCDGVALDGLCIEDGDFEPEQRRLIRILKF